MTEIEESTLDIIPQLSPCGSELPTNGNQPLKDEESKSGLLICKYLLL